MSPIFRILFSAGVAVKLAPKKFGWKVEHVCPRPTTIQGF